MHRCALPALALGIALATVSGCSGSSPTATPAPSALDPANALAPVGMVVREGGIIESAIGRGLLTLDSTSMTATWESLPMRVGQDNDAVFALSVNEFLKPVDAGIKAFRRTADGFELDYEFTHPFRSSELSGRADLGFSGMFLLGVTPIGPTSFTWFKDDTDLITDPRWVTNADGYYQPKGLVDTSGIPGNAFPYQLLIDERGTGNRKDASTEAAISNGGSPTGNFTAPDGWQTGDSKTWTGYGVIHQGQKIRNTIAIDGDQLTGTGSLPIITVLLAKYADPKSATPGFEHRLPASPPDVVGDFGYRMPHGALDVPEARLAAPPSGWLPNVQTDADFHVYVTDWDARATETTETSLKDDADATHVAQGESGMPLLAVCIPDVLGDRTTVVALNNTPVDNDTAYGGDAGQDSGHQGDELLFSTTGLTKPAGTDQEEGDYLGWLRVTDVEVATQSDYLVALKDDLTPITGEFPLPVTYHPFFVRLGGDCDPPQGVGWATEFGNPDTSDINLYGLAVDSTNNSYTFGNFSTQIDLGGGLIPSAGLDDLFLVKHDNAGNFVWGKTWGGVRGESGRAVAISSTGDIWIGGVHGGPVDMGGGELTPGGSYGMVVARFDSDGNHEFSDTIGETGFNWLTGLVLTPADAVFLSGYSDGTIDLGSGVQTSAGSEDIVVGSLDAAGAPLFGVMFGGTGSDRGACVASDSVAGVYVGGSFSGTVDFGVGAPTAVGSTDAYLLRVDASNGDPDWVRAFPGADANTTQQVATDDDNQIYVAGSFITNITLGTVQLTGQGTDTAVFLGAFSELGAHQWSKSFFDTTAGLDLRTMAVKPIGDIYLGGSFYDSITFGGPQRFGNSSDAGYLAWFNADGDWLGDGQIGGSGGDEVRAIAFPTINRLLYAGYADGRVDMNPDCNVAEHLFDGDGAFFVAKSTKEMGW